MSRGGTGRMGLWECRDVRGVGEMEGEKWADEMGAVQEAAHGTGNWEREGFAGLEPWHRARHCSGTGWDCATLCLTGMGPNPTAEHQAHQTGAATPKRKGLCPMECVLG